MAKQTNLYITSEINGFGLIIENGDGTGYQTLYTASAEDAIVKSLMATSSDTAAMNVVLAVNDGVADHIIGTVNVPIAAGTNGSTAAVDLLSASMLPGLPVDQYGKRILPMKNGHILKAAVLVAVTAAKAINIYGIAEEY